MNRHAGARQAHLHSLLKERQLPYVKPEHAPLQQYRVLAFQSRESARKELLPNVRRMLEASADRWEILAERAEESARCGEPGAARRRRAATGARKS